MKKILLLMMILPFLAGCKRGGHVTTGTDFNDEKSKYHSGLFDSLMWAQYDCPEDEEKTVYEWNWAYDVRETLDVDDLDSLTTLCREEDEGYQSYAESPSTADMTTATEVYATTGRFRMLNAFQALAELTAETPLGMNADCYYDDYCLWESLYKEFDEWYKSTGNERFMTLFCYYRHLADLRTDILLEELASFSKGGKALEHYANTKPPRIDQKWQKTHPAIHRWYNYRMKMADKLRRHNASQAQCLRALTYKQYTRYVEFEKEYEEEYNYEWE